MASVISRGAMCHLFPSVGPALMISMEYIDLGKWLAAVEGGARFGSDLVFLVLLFNCAAILCQYVSTCIGTATGRNLAEICSEEYCRVACISLGVQAEVSMIVSDVSTVLGISYGLNLLFGMDIYTSIFYATFVMVLLPTSVTLLDNCKAETLYVGIAGFALLFYVFGVLISQPEIPFMMNGIFPKLSGDNAYSVMALLGANVMAHNFYIQSSIVKQQNKQSSIAAGALFHDHFFATLFIFSGIFLVNYVLMNSAAAVFASTDVVFNFQDVSMLMDQIFRNPIAPLAFFLVLFFSSQITGLSRNIGGQVILRCFFGINLSLVHQTSVKALAVIPVLYCAKSAGAEGIYQLLILCQVVLATLLPSSVIPLFRVASSRSIMGSLKISWHTEIFALLAFLLMFVSNIFFATEMIFGNSSWMVNVTGGIDNSLTVTYVFLLLIACASIGLTLYLAVTPLRSASGRPEAEIWRSNVEKNQQPGLPEVVEENNLDSMKYEEIQDSYVEDALEKSLEFRNDNSLLEFSAESRSDKSVLQFSADSRDHKQMLELHEEQIESAIDSDQESQSTQSSSVTLAIMPPQYHQETPLPESNSVFEVDSAKASDRDSAGGLSDVAIQRTESKDSSTKDDREEDNNERDALDRDDSFKGFQVPPPEVPVPPPEVPVPLNIIKPKESDGLTGSGGSISKLPGLGRAARRQLASALDEFWANLFDFHGKLTQEATNRRLDLMLGLDLRTIGPALKADAMGAAEASKSFFPDANMGPVFPPNSRDYNNSPRQRKELPFGVQMGSSSWSQNMQPLNVHGNLLDTSERAYSSLKLPHYSDNRDHQPATIHGYQLASYLRELNAATSSPYASSSPQILPPTPKSVSSIAALRNQVMQACGANELSSLGPNPNMQNSALSRINRLQTERPYYDPLFAEAGESALNSSVHAKKYHSSPDISALIALGRASYLNELNRGAPIGPRLGSGRMATEQSQYLNPVSRTGVPLAFDQLSPPKLHRDVFSHQSLNPDTKSLWSRQPFEQLFGVAGKSQSGRDRGVIERPSLPRQESLPYAESGAKLLQSLRFCIVKLLKLEGSEWLFGQNGGSDEELIDLIAASEKYLNRVDNGKTNQALSVDISCLQPIPNCGNDCIWQAALVVSFGVWCIRRILELSLIESRPELWGKYTYVLNRLQGIIEPAFSKPRRPLASCTCLERTTECMKNFNPSLQNGFLRPAEKPIPKPLTTASMVRDIIKEVEVAVSGRKGRTGTAAGDVAFPKGKENLASVLKRYKRRLLNKAPGSNNEGASMLSRKVQSSASSSSSLH